MTDVMRFTVDVHHHILPEFFWRATNEGANPAGGIAPPPWSKEGAIAYLDDAGTHVAITSISTPSVHMGDDKTVRDAHQECRSSFQLSSHQ